jgi:dipeptidyl aminopeptidase/acylaminoacyl peptidase
MTRIVRALFTLVGVALLMPAVALGSFGGGNGVLAYAAPVFGDEAEGYAFLESAIWAVDPATGAQLRLTSGHDDGSPSFSPSGNMLAFTREQDGIATVYVAQSDGAQARALAAGSEPAFSPDGQQVVFVGAGGLYAIGIAPGSPITRITAHPGDREPRWGSTGSIAFERTDEWRTRSRGPGARVERHVANELDVVTPPSVKVRRVMIYSKNTDMWPDWAPDGGTLTVALCLGDPGEQLSLPGAPRRLEGHPPLLPAVVFHSSCAPAVWAPDGQGSAEPDTGALAGSPGTSCPKWIPEGEPISWQPLVPGTQTLATATCAPAPASEGRQGVKAISLTVGSKSCLYSQRKHRWKCFSA